MKLRRILTVVALAALPLAAACNGDSTGSGQASVTGTYKLETVQGNKLPATLFSEQGYTLAVTSGSMTLRSDRTYSLQIDLRETEGTSVTTETYTEQGTYEQNNNAVTFTESGETESYAGSVNGNTLTFTDNGVALVFRK